MERLSNEEVLHSAGQEWSSMRTTQQRQLKFVSHLLRENSLEKFTLLVVASGPRSQGRQRITFLENLAIGGGYVGATTVQDCSGQEWFSETGRQRKILIRYTVEEKIVVWKYPVVLLVSFQNNHLQTTHKIIITLNISKVN